MNPHVKIILIVIAVLILLLSFLGFVIPPVNHVAWFLILFFVFCGALIKYEFIGVVLLAELAIGGHGYLFSITVAGFPISIRIGLFVVACITLLYHLIRKRKFPKISGTPLAIPFIVLVSIIVLGMIRGMAHNNGLIVFFDANAYLSILYVVFFVEAFSSHKALQKAFTTLLSFGVALSLVTIALLGIYGIFHYDTSLKAAISVDSTIQQELSGGSAFSQGVIAQRTNPQAEQFQLDPSVTTKTKPASYRWLRDTGVAQISYVSGRFFRVFFPSHIIMLATFFIALSLLWNKNSRRRRILLISSLISMGIALFISFSRSLWLGGAVALLIFTLVWFRQTLHRQRALLVIFVLLLIIIIVPLTTQVGSIFTERIRSILNPGTEVAGTHRIELAKALYQHIKDYPVWGSGFGTLVSFPTVLPNGQVITAAFYIYELAYLDVIVKLGGIGLGLFFLFYGYVIYRLIKIYKSSGPPIAMGLLAGFIACLIANITTPIFTHPLGFCLVAIISAFLFASHEYTTPARHVE